MKKEVECKVEKVSFQLGKGEIGKNRRQKKKR